MSTQVCIVEDYEDNRVLVTALLTAAGMTVRSAADGQSLDELLRGGFSPDIFLLDLSLPGEDGTSLMRRLKADEAWRGRPVVALTAHAMDGDAERAIAEGFDGYVTKPIDIGSFAATVQRFLA